MMRRLPLRWLLWILLMVALAASVQTAPAQVQETVRFAVIGDFGKAGQPEADVAALVRGWNPRFIVTTGDNNYPNGEASTIDKNIGQYYHDFIYRYTGSYGEGAAWHRFFPVLGNHDWRAANAQPYLDYFTLPGNERYYEFIWGPVHFFMLDSDTQEPDGTSSTSTQANWLKGRLAASRAPWQFVVMHHPPFSSGQHGSHAYMQWPFQEWGADAVLAGHDHTYERLAVNGLPFFVNGLGGHDRLYPFGTVAAGSQVRYNADNGAMLVDATATQVTFQFITRAGETVDSYTLSAAAPPPRTSTTIALPTVQTARARVSHRNDDAEERGSDGVVTLGSTDLELVNDSGWSGPQAVGLRFAGLTVPKGATITQARLEFTTDERDTSATTLTLHAQAADNAGRFTTAAYGLSGRSRTAASVAWSNVPSWQTVGQMQKSPNLATVVQEVVSRPGWQSGNALVILVTGTGERTAVAFEGNAATAPLLHVEYTVR